MKALERTCGQDCVDWAIGLLDKEVSGRNVEILAGMTPPFNAFEMADLRDRVLHDLGVQELARSEAVAAYARELAAEAALDKRSPFALLQELALLCIAEEYMRELYNGYLLYNAWDELRHRDIQFYWDGATLDNIERLVRAELARLAACEK